MLNCSELQGMEYYAAANVGPIYVVWTVLLSRSGASVIDVWQTAADVIDAAIHKSRKRLRACMRADFLNILNTYCDLVLKLKKIMNE